MSGQTVPDEWTFEVDLRDGTPIRIAPVAPEDAEDIAKGYRELSPASRFARFHTSSPELSDRQVRYLTDVDQVDHVAIGAREVATDEGIGVARYVRLPEEPEVAEAAVTVLDDWQGLGAGTVLLACLAALARSAGVTTFRNYVLSENEPMLRLFRELGAKAQPEAPGLQRVDLALPETAVDLPDTPTGRVFRAVSRHTLEPADRRFPPVYEAVRPVAGADDRRAHDRPGRAEAGHRPGRGRQEPGEEGGALREWLDRVFDAFRP